MFTISPKKGKLKATERPTPILVTFNATQEVLLREHPIIFCHVIERNVDPQGEVVARIPIPLSVQVANTRYLITPSNELHFGGIAVNTKKSRTFTIENKNDSMDFSFVINSLNSDGSPQINVSLQKLTSSNQSSLASRKSKKLTPATVKSGTSSSAARTVAGPFVVFPNSGFVAAMSDTTITVECSVDSPGLVHETLLIDIEGLILADNSNGIQYSLLAESFIPGFDVENFESIFEEHPICHNLSMWNEMQDHSGCGVYLMDEKRFLFNSVLIGAKVKARFRISNNNKIPCDVQISVKPLRPGKQMDVFEVVPTKSSLSPFGHVYLTVTFGPLALQQYTAVLETTLDVPAGSVGRSPSLTFELSGEGALPQIRVLKPTLRNKQGQPVLLFKRCLLGSVECMQFVVTNDGPLSCNINVSLLNSDGAFSVAVSSGCSQNYSQIVGLEDSNGVEVGVRERTSFDVLFRPIVAERTVNELLISPTGNPYGDLVIRLIGEGYEAEVTLDNIEAVNEAALKSVDDNVPAIRNNLLQFGECYICQSKTLNVQLTNHSLTESFRFAWPDDLYLAFSPLVGHLHPATSKNILVTFKSSHPIRIHDKIVRCHLTKIIYSKPVAEVPDWDDRIKVVRWVDAQPPPIVHPHDDLEASASISNHHVCRISTRKSHVKHLFSTRISKFSSFSFARLSVDEERPLALEVVRPSKKKVTETEVEPQHTELLQSGQAMELMYSATVDFSLFQIAEEKLHFQDTLMFETRYHKIKFSNIGNVSLEFSWHVEGSSANSIAIANSPDVPSANAALQCSSSPVVTEQPLGAATSADDDLRTKLPFSIEPNIGILLPKETVPLTVKFSPLDVGYYAAKLICQIPNLKREDKGPVIKVTGKSMMPYCYFELENSDYLHRIHSPTVIRKSDAVQLPFDTRVIEFESFGVGVKTVKKFNVINPTDAAYTFYWTNTDLIQQKGPSPFSCLVPHGFIQSGAQAEMAFSFIALTTDVEESVWNFEIKEHSVVVPFLLAAHSKDPFIVFDTPLIDFGAFLIGLKSSKTFHIFNNEDVPFVFEFVESSLYSAGYQDRLELNPKKGILPAKTKFPITVSFTATNEKKSCLRVKCEVTKKLHPLCLTVKGEGYSVKSVLVIEDPSGQKTELSSLVENTIDFGNIEIEEQALRQMHIVNNGKIGFDFVCEFETNSQRGQNFVTISPCSGNVPQGEKISCQLAFYSARPKTLKSKLHVKISFSVTYTIQVICTCEAPNLQPSFRVHDFGYCFIHRPGMPTNSKSLIITNRDRKEISIECLTQPTEVISHNFEPVLMHPNQSTEILFVFCPLNRVAYSQTFIFKINGLSKMKIDILGRGTELKIEVAEPDYRLVRLGALSPGRKITRIIPVVNKSRIPVTVDFVLNPLSSHLQKSKALSLSHAENFTLLPFSKKDARQQVANVEITFAPKIRVPTFSEEVSFEYGNYSQILFYISGSCQGMEISLSTNLISFGVTVLKNAAEKELVMRNTGEVGARFQWDANAFEPDFSISPVSGYISAGMDVQFDVIFHPREVKSSIRNDNLLCKIEGGQPLSLSLTGACVLAPPPKEVLTFSTNVRQKETKIVTIFNKSSVHWNIQPVIEGNQWTGPATFSVPPKFPKPYEITYYPLTMTTDAKKHNGVLTFPLPDGSILQYALLGTAEAPKPNAKILRDIPCKTTYTEMLNVSNWLSQPQRFYIRFDLIRPEKHDASTKITGLSSIIVPGNSSVDYRLNFFAYKENLFNFKVFFTSELSSEYQFYEITFQSIKPGIISTISLQSACRQRKEFTVVLDNPLPISVTLTAATNVLDILMPDKLVLAPQSKGSFTLEYFPLCVGSVHGRLEFTSNELGLFPYELSLKAIQAEPEKPIYFRTYLGENLTSTVQFHNYCKAKTDYITKLKNSNFHVDRTVTALPGSDVTFEVTFEPTTVGESFVQLILTSHVGGEYRFPLYGTCLLPRPQGPLMVKSGSSIAVTFKNVFHEAMVFVFAVDNPLFHVNKPEETIKSHKDYKILVFFEGNTNQSKAPVVGKLMVSCPKMVAGESNLQWVYYLKGITVDPKEAKDAKEAKDNRR